MSTKINFTTKIMINYFDTFKKEIPTLEKLADTNGVNGFFGEEALRFYSIVMTLLGGFELSQNASIDERYITHILARSLLENYFWLIYLFDDTSKKNERYEELINSFKRDYNKLLNEPQLTNKDKLEPSNPTWSNLPRTLDINSMLAQITNDYGNRLNYLYSIYRLTSFDTHGKNLRNIFQTTFEKTGNFPTLNLDYTFNLVANEYLVILQNLRNKNEI